MAGNSSVRMEVDLLAANWHIIDEGIQKVKSILTGHIPRLTADDYMKYYTCIYNTSTRSRTGCIDQMYEIFKTTLEESIHSVVIPALKDKHDSCLLVGFLNIWERYMTMARHLIGIFHYIDRAQNLPSLSQVATDCFCDQVCTPYFLHFQNALISMINQGRQGAQIDKNLMKNVLIWFSTIRDRGNEYQEKFQQALLSDAANYCASECFLSGTSSEILPKAVCFFSHEENRAQHYLIGSMLEKYLQALRQQLTAMLELKKSMEAQQADSLGNTPFQELLSKYSSMSITDQAAPQFPQ